MDGPYNDLMAHIHNIWLSSIHEGLLVMRIKSQRFNVETLNQEKTTGTELHYV